MVKLLEKTKQKIIQSRKETREFIALGAQAKKDGKAITWRIKK